MNTLIIYYGILVTILFIGGPAPANGLECYDCNTISITNQILACSDDFPENGIGIPKRICPTRSVCVKIKTQSNAGNIVSRGCTADPGSLESSMCRSSSNEQGESSNCFCTTDLCNGVEQKAVLSNFALVSVGVLGKLTVSYLYIHK